jgi:hypothetical protein
MLLPSSGDEMCRFRNRLGFFCGVFNDAFSIETVASNGGMTGE